MSLDSKSRLRKACDACSIRKVKCDESGPPCRSCASLDIPCTYDRPSRRRGPPNRHAEAFKKQKVEHDSSASDKTTSPPFIEDVSPVSKSRPEPVVPALSGESICSLPTLQRLVDDYFCFIHPLIPVPHEPSFRAAFNKREDISNKRFLALLAAMIGTLTASFPRRPRMHLRTDAERQLFPNSMALVIRCHEVALEARGAGYLDWSTTVYDAAISYLLGLCSGYVYNIRRCRMYFGESMTILRVHGLTQPPQSMATLSAKSVSSSNSFDPFGNQPETSMDLIAQELGRRLFYVCLVGFQSLQQMGSSDGRTYVPPETPTERYPPLPLEVDDENIFRTHLNPQPSQVVSQLTGFNANIKIFNSYNTLSALEVAFGTGESEIFDWDRQKKTIWDCLQRAKSCVSQLPPELTLGQAATSSLTSNLESSGIPPSMEYPYADRRRIQYEIQKANIHISQLSTRSYLVDKYWSLYEAFKTRQRASHGPPLSERSNTTLPGDDPTATATPAGTESTSPDADTHAQVDFIGKMMCEERALIMQDLLLLLKSVNEINIEPNGASFTNKTRQIASTLLNLPRTGTRISATDTSKNRSPPSDANLEGGGSAAPTGPHAITPSDAEEYLRIFLDILVRLEGVGVSGAGTNHPNNYTQTNTNPNAPANPPSIVPMGADTKNPTDSKNRNNNKNDNGLRNMSLSSADHQRAMSYKHDTTEEEEENRQWASFKDWQTRFAESDGVLYSL